MFAAQAGYPSHETEQADDADQAGQQAAADEEDHVVRRHILGYLGRHSRNESETRHDQTPGNDADPRQAIHDDPLFDGCIHRPCRPAGCPAIVGLAQQYFRAMAHIALGKISSPAIREDGRA